MNHPKATIFIVDDEPLIRDSLKRLLKSAGWHVEAFEGAVELLARGRPQGLACAILDLQLVEGNGLELQNRLAQAGVDLPVIFLTGRGDIRSTVAAMKEGAVDFLTKPVDEADLFSAVERALAIDLSRRDTVRRSSECRHRLATLTTREREILEQVIAGKLNKMIAADLDIAEKTVKVHRGRVMEKMRVKSVADLVRLAEVAGVRVESADELVAAI
jgi:FixJ family two-component response regulator